MGGYFAAQGDKPCFCISLWKICIVVVLNQVVLQLNLSFLNVNFTAKY